MPRDIAPPVPASRIRAARLEALRRQIAVAGGGGGPSLPLDLPEIAHALPPGGLPRAAVHEILGEDGGGAAVGFAAWLAGRLVATDGDGRGDRPAIWVCAPPGPGMGEPYLPGLVALGLPAERLILVRARGTTERLWAAEEALRSGEAAAVVIEMPAAGRAAHRPVLDQTAGRRLQLAAKAGGRPGLLLRPGAADAPAASSSGGAIAVSRWQVRGLPGGRWRLDLLRCRGVAAEQAPGWILEWTDDGEWTDDRAGKGTDGWPGRPAHRLAVAAIFRDRPPDQGIAGPGIAGPGIVGPGIIGGEADRA